MRPRFLAIARYEAEAAVRWHEERESGLGARFVSEVEKAAMLIVEAPRLWPEHPGERRA